MKTGYAGLVTLNATIDKVVVSVDGSDVPLDADALPTYRIYGPAGVLETGSVSYKDTGSITGATNATPTVVTSVGHGLTTGTKITISGILGNTGANGTYVITKLTSNTFSIAVDTSGGSAYTSGGVWHVTGVYDIALSPTTGKNYASGGVYNVFVYAAYSATAKIIDSFVFQVT